LSFVGFGESPGRGDKVGDKVIDEVD